MSIERIGEINFLGSRYKISLHLSEEVLHLEEMIGWIDYCCQIELHFKTTYFESPNLEIGNDDMDVLKK